MDILVDGWGGGGGEGAHVHAHNCRRTCTHIRTHTQNNQKWHIHYKVCKPHKMSKTCNNCINNSKQYTLKEAMAMHTPNVSCESDMSLKPNCTLECIVGLKMASTHSLPVVKSAHIHFTQNARVW